MKPRKPSIATCKAPFSFEELGAPSNMSLRVGCKIREQGIPSSRDALL